MIANAGAIGISKVLTFQGVLKQVIPLHDGYIVLYQVTSLIQAHNLLPG